MERYFAPSLPPVSIRFDRADGTPLTAMTGWEMAPHDVTGEHTFRVGATFADTPDTHYYGLGKYQDGVLDLRGRTIDCRHDYDRPAGEAVCVPFMVTDKGYAILWDNHRRRSSRPSAQPDASANPTSASRVVLRHAGRTSDDLYAGYARLTGATPLPPKAAFGLIQSKARYETQAELTAVADGYWQRRYPLDIIVLDWFYWTRMGQMDIDRTAFPDPVAMNAHLKSQGVRSIVSIWPRFEKESRWFDTLAAKGWLLPRRGGQAGGRTGRSDRIGRCADRQHQPGCARLVLGQDPRRYLQRGLRFRLVDETEPDLWCRTASTMRSARAIAINVFPLLHTLSVAEGRRATGRICAT